MLADLQKRVPPTPPPGTWRFTLTESNLHLPRFVRFFFILLDCIGQDQYKLQRRLNRLFRSLTGYFQVTDKSVVTVVNLPFSIEGIPPSP